MEIKRREGEPTGTFLYRFTKKVRQSGILVESKRRRFKGRAVSKRSRRASALYREQRKKDLEKARKMGTL